MGLSFFVVGVIPFDNVNLLPPRFLVNKYLSMAVVPGSIAVDKPG